MKCIKTHKNLTGLLSSKMCCTYIYNACAFQSKKCVGKNIFVMCTVPKKQQGGDSE